jgi:flagellar hook assembly protein FlgD
MNYINLSVYNMKGQLVEELINGYQPSGRHDLIWDGSRRSSGIYILKISATGMNATRKVMLIK